MNSSNDEQRPAGKPISRGGFLRGCLGAVAALFVASRRRLMATVSAPPRRRHKWGMAIDMDKCVGCRACVVSCRLENNVPSAGPQQSALDRSIYWMDMLPVEGGEFAGLHGPFIPTPCNHCENPPCVKVCPVGATFVNEEGIVGQIWARCIGCRYCTTACPYTRRYFNWLEPHWPEELKNQLNPDVATRPKGVVEKCTFCHHRIRKARQQAKLEGRTLNDDDVRLLPACAQSCPTGAITFGDLDDPHSTVAQLAQSPRAVRLQEELGTRPKVVYLREVKWRE